MGRAPRRPRRKARGEVLAWPPRAPDPLDGRLRRSRLEGDPDARALERRQPADRALLRHAHRPDQLLPDELRRGAAVRVQGARLEVPGPVRAHRLRLPRRLRPRPEAAEGGLATCPAPTTPCTGG